MRQDKARSQILGLFREWTRLNGHHTPYSKVDGGLVFFGWLESNRPDVLDFASQSEKWQVVHSWLRTARLVTH